MRTLFTVVLLAALAGCGTPAPITTEVRIPVPVKCATSMPAKPDYRTPKLSTGASEYEKITALALDWVDSRTYEVKLEAGLQACL